MKSWKIIIFFLIVLGVAGFFFFSHQESDSQKIHISIGKNKISAEVADTSAERTLGLGNREKLEKDSGMLFVFESPEKPGFWMKDTNFPLDFIWIDKDKKIIDITPDVKPETFPTVYYPAGPVQYVLEVSGGFSEIHQIKIGDKADF